MRAPEECLVAERPVGTEIHLPKPAESVTLTQIRVASVGLVRTESRSRRVGECAIFRQAKESEKGKRNAGAAVAPPVPRVRLVLTDRPRQESTCSTTRR